MMGRIRRFFAKRDRGTLAGWFQQLCSAGASIVTLPLFVRYLGPEQCGVWLTFQSLISLAGLADFGFSFVVARQTAYSLGARQGVEGCASRDIDPTLIGWPGVATCFHAARIGNVVACLVAIPVVVGVGLYAAGQPTLQVAAASELTITLALLGGAMIVRLLGRPYAAVLDGSGELYRTRITSGMQQLTMGAGACVLLVFGGQLRAIATWALITAVLEAAVLARMFTAKSHLSVWRVGPVRLDQLRRMFTTALPLGLVNVGSFFVNSVQTPLIAAILGPAWVAPYYVAQRVGQFGNIAALQLAYPQLPRFTGSLGARDIDGARRLLWSTTMRVTLWSAGGVLAFVCVLPFVTRHVFHLQPLPMATNALIGLDLFLLNSTVVWGLFVLASGRNPFWPWILAAGALNVLLLKLCLEPLGVLAIPMASLVAGLATTYWQNVFHGRRLWNQLAKTPRIEPAALASASQLPDPIRVN